jgi:DNA topoisomerase-1
VYVGDDMPGIRRVRRGKNFQYLHPDGSRVTDEEELARIRKLGIPPAYEAVWICPLPQGHLQATGRDARGRKQYLYHPDWRAARDETKFERMLSFGAALPRIRARVKRDLDTSLRKGVSRATVLAAVVHLLDTTRIRIGNDEYARSNKSYGLTTLRKRHAALKGSELRLRFKGKSGVTHQIALQDRRIARIVRRCQELPGQELFKYMDKDGAVHSIGSSDVNDYLREASGGEFTAKDFRTWHGSVLAFQFWRKAHKKEEKPGKSLAKRLLTDVAQSLGNTVSVCRKAYVHPRVLSLMSGSAGELSTGLLQPQARRSGLSAAESALLALLKAEAELADKAVQA